MFNFWVKFVSLLENFKSEFNLELMKNLERFVGKYEFIREKTNPFSGKSGINY